MATIESTLLAALGKLLQPEPDWFVPEVFSGRCSSPLWFIGLNPGGAGTRPSFTQLWSDPHSYADFYFNRFKDMDISVPQVNDSYGNRLSKTVRNALMLTNRFAMGAGVPREQRWELMMKTNRWGTHASNEAQLLKRDHIHAMNRILLPLIAQWQPAVVVVFGKASEMFDGADLIPGRDEPNLPDDPTAPLMIHYTHGYLTLSEEGEVSQRQFEYFKRLGEQYLGRSASAESVVHEDE